MMELKLEIYFLTSKLLESYYTEELPDYCKTYVAIYVTLIANIKNAYLLDLRISTKNNFNFSCKTLYFT